MGAKDVKQKGTKIVLNGEEKILRYDLNAFAELEELYGDIEDAMNALEKGSIKAVRAILWAGLIHDEETDETGHPLLSPKTVGSWIEIKDLTDISEVLTEALGDALPEDAEQEAQDQPVPLDHQPKKGRKKSGKKSS